MTTVFLIRDGEWQAMYQGQVARAVFNSRGAALAWIATCQAQGKFRA